MKVYPQSGYCVKFRPLPLITLFGSETVYSTVVALSPLIVIEDISQVTVKTAPV